MSSTFESVRTLAASKTAKNYMRQLHTKGYFEDQGDYWRLGAALGIAKGERLHEAKRDTYQNINSLDPDGVFGAIIIGLYPNSPPEDRAKILEDFAEWGIREIYRREEKGTLDFSKLLK